MKITVLLGAIVSSTLAQTLGSVPACAQPCVTNYTTGSSIAGCNSLDIACICSNSSFLSGIACCLASVCSQADQAAAVAFAQDLCRTNKVTNLPNSVVCSSTSASAGSATSSAMISATQTTQTITAVSTNSAASSPAAVQTAGAVQQVVNIGAGIAGGMAVVVGMW